MAVSRKRIVTAALGLGLVAAIALALAPGFGPDSGRTRRDKGPVPVEVAAVRRGPIELKRTFSGTLEAAAEFVVAPKVDGRVVHLDADLGDVVTRGQVVAELDSREYAQNVIEARAGLAVARATHLEARTALQIAEREYRRIEQLRKTGAVSASQDDTARAEWVAKQAALEVAAARVQQAEAALAAAEIRLGYTKVAVEWNAGNATRVIAERFVDEGETVSENTPLLSVVELDPIVGVVLVTEKEYARMAPGQAVAIGTDAHPDRTFSGTISRIAPVFNTSTRQARVEVAVPNADGALKPGMFIRATVVMAAAAEATLVPQRALTRRERRDGLFVLSQDGTTVSWREVELGIREGEAVQILDDALSGRVVTLGQQFLSDGSEVVIGVEPAESTPAGATQ